MTRRRTIMKSISPYAETSKLAREKLLAGAIWVGSFLLGVSMTRRWSISRRLLPYPESLETAGEKDMVSARSAPCFKIEEITEERLRIIRKGLRSGPKSKFRRIGLRGP